MTGLTEIDLNNFEFAVVGSELDKTGAFSCSDSRLSQLQQNIYRSQEGNMLSVPTDCPQRERAGYTGDMQVYAPTAFFNMDMRAFMDKWLANVRIEQQEDGQIPNVVPRIDSNKYIDGEDNPCISSAGWADACIIIPYRMYQAYGDKRVLQDNYAMMQSWLGYVAQQAAIIEGDVSAMTAEERERKQYLWTAGFNLGDWLTPSIIKATGNPMETAFQTKEYVSTAVYAYVTELMVKIAEVLEDTEAKQHYEELNAKIRNAFAAEYVDENGLLPVRLQGIYALALKMKLIPEALQEKSAAQLAELIKENDYCLDTGFISGPFLLDVLVEHGYSELAYKILFQTKAPSWLYQVDKGATTIWENWYAIGEDGTRQKFSYNHFAFGCVGDFMYRHLLGLNPDAPGYQIIRISPDFNCGLNEVEGELQSPYGKIAVHWKRDNEKVELNIETPPNTEGVVKIQNFEEYFGNGQNQFMIPLDVLSDNK